MSIVWHRPSEKLPDNNQMCLLLGKDGDAVCGPIMFKAMDGGGAWIDLFATPEAGSMYSPEVVGMWCDWEEAKPKE